MDRKRILQGCLDDVIEELEREQEDDSCIMAHLVLRDVLAAQGIRDSFHLTVNPIVLNPPLAAAHAVDPGIITRDDVDWEEMGYAMLRFEDEGVGKWPAHLITIVPNTFPVGAAMVDLTIGRINRFGKGFALGIIVAGVRESFLRGEFVYDIPMNGCRAIYKANPDDESFRDTEVWRSRIKKDRIVKRIIRRLGV